MIEKIAKKICSSYEIDKIAKKIASSFISKQDKKEDK